jgi:hypothetical protein
MQYIVFLPIYMCSDFKYTINFDSIAIWMSIFVIVISALSIIVKALCLMYFEEDEDHWIKRFILTGICCWDCL